MYNSLHWIYEFIVIAIDQIIVTLQSQKECDQFVFAIEYVWPTLLSNSTSFDETYQCLALSSMSSDHIVCFYGYFA